MPTHAVLPNHPAPEAGDYEELNIFGTPTGKVATVAEGEPVPAAPLGYTWAPRRGPGLFPE